MHWKGTERHPITASAAAAASVNQTIGGSGAGGEVEGGEGDEGLHEYPSLRYHQQDSSRRSPSASRSPDAETLSHNHGYDHGHGHGEAPFLAIRGHLLPSASSSSRGYSVDTARSRPGSSTMEGSSPSSFSAAAAAVDNRSGRPWEL